MPDRPDQPYEAPLATDRWDDAVRSGSFARMLSALLEESLPPIGPAPAKPSLRQRLERLERLETFVALLGERTMAALERFHDPKALARQRREEAQRFAEEFGLADPCQADRALQDLVEYLGHLMDRPDSRQEIMRALVEKRKPSLLTRHPDVEEAVRRVAEAWGVGRVRAAQRLREDRQLVRDTWPGGFDLVTKLPIPAGREG